MPPRPPSAVPASAEIVRKALRVLLVAVAAVLAVALSAPADAGSRFEPWIDSSDRQAVRDAFAVEYAIDTPEMRWLGDHDRCEPGASSSDLRLATVRRLNFYRALAGVPASVVVDEEMSVKAQYAALMMSSEGVLSHHPGEEYACFSQTGQLAAANSNLYLGRTGPTAIDGYVEDPGEKNRDVGHRLTILHPPTRRMGVGHVDGTTANYPANALWVFDDNVFDDSTSTREPEGFIAWPPRGYVPAELVYPRWSFALDDADFSEATVEVAVDGVPVEAEIVARISKEGEVPSSVLVWEPQGALAALAKVTPTEGAPGVVLPSGDLVVTVTVGGVGLAADRNLPPARLAMAEGEQPGSAEPTLDQRTATFTYSVVVMAPSTRSGLDIQRSVTSAGAFAAAKVPGLFTAILR